jgi:hypothetical protein
MDRDRQYRGKCPYEEVQGNYNRNREHYLRQKLDREQDEQRQQLRIWDRNLDRAGSSSWRS